MKLPETLPRQPFIGLGIAAVAGIAVAELAPSPTIGLVIVAALAVPALFSRHRLIATYLFVVAGFFSIHSLRQTNSAGVRLARELGPERVAITARGVVVSEPKLSGRGTASFLFRLREVQQRDNIRASNATVSAYWRGDVRYGDELQLFGVLQPLDGPRNPGEFDMRAYLARRDIRRALIVRYPENGRLIARSGGNRIVAAAQQSRRWMQAALSRGLEDSPDLQKLISGMVLGVRDATDEIEEHFQQTGTLHLFAVSGLHVGIIAYLLWTIATMLRLSRRWAVGLIIPALFFYAAVTGFNTPSIRAATMAAVLLGGYFIDRKAPAMNSVAAAGVLILAVDTNQLFSPGFQLSFAVVIMIVLLAERLYQTFVRWSAPDPFLPRSLVSAAHRLFERSWGTIARGMSVSLAAWLGSLLLILPYFHIITPVALLANVVVVPLAFFVLATGMMSLLATPIASWVAVVFNNANWSFGSAILLSVDLFARLPASHFYMEWPRWPSGARAEMTALDVGAGAALHFRSRRADWLLDCGPERDFRRIVRSYLRSRGVNAIDGLVLTHGDASHIGAAASVVRGFRPNEIIDTPAPDRSRVHRAFIDFLMERRIPRQLCTAGGEFDLARNVTARVLYPPEKHRASNADDQALVAQLIVRDRWRVLLMSDSGEATERALLSSDADLQSDIIIKGQHRSGQSGSPEFLARVQPRAIVASSLPFPESERIQDDWAAMVAARGIKLLRQDETGAVTLRFFRDHWEAAPFLSGETFRSTSR